MSTIQYTETDQTLVEFEEDLLEEFEKALRKILKTTNIEKAKTIAADALGLDVEDFVEDEDYYEDGDDLYEIFTGESK